jgi:hypothetical protein
MVGSGDKGECLTTNSGNYHTNYVAAGHGTVVLFPLLNIMLFNVITVCFRMLLLLSYR